MEHKEASKGLRRRQQALAHRDSAVQVFKNTTRVTDEDRKLSNNNGMHPDVIKALRMRRGKLFANEIKGAVTKGRLSRCIFFSYAAPSFSTVPLTMLLSVYGIQFYERIGAQLAMIAFFQALARGFDVVTDPTMSYVTDSCRSKRGRRRPFLVTGCIPYGLSLFLLLTPWPGFGPSEVSMWFGCFYILFFLCNTYTNIPYDAMAPELTDNQDDRSKLFFTCTVFDGLGGLCAVLMPSMVQLFINKVRPAKEGGTTDGTKTCDIPGEGGIPGHINLIGCTGWDGMSLTQEFKAWKEPWLFPQNATADTLGLAYDPNCTALFDKNLGVYCGDPAVKAWCECHDRCQAAVSLDNTRGAYSVVGLFFGLWYIVTQFNLYARVKERSQMAGGAQLSTPVPMLPSMLNTMSNKPFTLLLPAWVCDSLVNAIISSLLTYYVRYIVQPEFSDGCDAGRNPSWQCSSDMVLAASCTMVLFAAFCSTPIWLKLSSTLGKRNTWLLWSLTMAGTNMLFMFVGKGDVVPCIVVSALNGLPMSAKFLADAILADVIDYDEFLTGQRAEATYTMFKSFLPKIAAIPASAIPIALLGAFGHIAPKNGQIQRQVIKDENGNLVDNVALQWYIRTAIIIVPSFLSFLAFLFKARFPLKTAKQNDAIAVGIGLHLLDKPAPCPVTNVPYATVKMTEEQRSEANGVDYFLGLTVAERMSANPKATALALLREAKQQLVIAVMLLLVAVTGTGLTWQMLTPVSVVAPPEPHSYNDTLRNCTSRAGVLMAGDDYSFVPVLFIVLFGVSITGVGAAVLRVQGATGLVAKPPSRRTANLIIKYRRLRLRVATFYLPTIYAVFASCLLDLMACLMCRRRKTSTKVMPAPRREGVGGATGWDEDFEGDGADLSDLSDLSDRYRRVGTVVLTHCALHLRGRYARAIRELHMATENVRANQIQAAYRGYRFRRHGTAAMGLTVDSAVKQRNSPEVGDSRKTMSDSESSRLLSREGSSPSLRNVHRELKHTPEEVRALLSALDFLLEAEADTDAMTNSATVAAAQAQVLRAAAGFSHHELSGLHEVHGITDQQFVKLMTLEHEAEVKQYGEDLESERKMAAARGKARQDRRSMRRMIDNKEFEGMHLDEAFAAVDKDGSGHLTTTEVVELYKRCFGTAIGLERAEALLRASDLNGDARVTLADLKVMMAKQEVRYIVLQRGGFKAGLLAKMQSKMKKARKRSAGKSRAQKSNLDALAGAQALKGVDMDRVLSELDVGGDGYLCADEVVTLYKMCFGEVIGQARADALLGSSDSDPDKRVTVTELKRQLSEAYKGIELKK